MAPVQYTSDPFTYPDGDVAAGVLTRVYFRNTNVLAPVFYDALATRAPNPMLSDTAGVVEFFAEPGLYDLMLNGVRFAAEVTGDGGPGNPSATFLTFSAGAPGNPGVGKSFVYNDMGRTLQIVSVRISAATVTGLPLIVDINRNGTSIFTDQAKRPQLPISAAAGTVKVTDIDVTTLAVGEGLSVDVDQGNFSYLVVQVYVR